MTAGLDPRVKVLAPYYPALSDVTGYLNGRAGGWPHMFKEESRRLAPRIAVAPYYDVVNFARRVKAPGLYSWGYNDETCPPTSMYAAYGVITAENIAGSAIGLLSRLASVFMAVIIRAIWRAKPPSKIRPPGNV